MVDLLASAPNDGSWNSYVINLSGVAPGETLIVSAVMLNGEFVPANPQSAFVDNFKLVQVPEPSSFAMLGLAVLVFARRRR